MKKKCSKCKLNKPMENFYSDNRRIDKKQSACKICQNRDRKSYDSKKYIRNRDSKIKYSRDRYHRLLNIVMKELGSMCNCCGEVEKSFLAIDHVNNDGYRDKNKNGNRISGQTLLYRIIKENFPPDKYQILCMNCNHSKSKNNGICAHKIDNNIKVWYN